MSTPEVSSGARRRAWAWNAGLFLGALSWLFAGPLTLVPAGLLGFGLLVHRHRLELGFDPTCRGTRHLGRAVVGPDLAGLGYWGDKP